MGLPILRTSERTTWRTCPQKWWWGYREGLVPKGPPNFNLWFGTGIHLALASHYGKGRRRGKGAAGAVAVWRAYCADEYAMMKTFDGDDTAYVEAEALGVAMLENYLATYGADDHMFIIATEQSRRVIVYGHDGNPLVRYAYTMDGIYRDDDDSGQIKLLEHKTAGIVNLGHLPLDDQAGSYLTFESATLGINIQEITYNILRKALPKMDDRPTNADGFRLNKDGTVSSRQKTQEPLLIRHPVPRSAESRARILDRVIVEVGEMNRMREDRSLVYKNPHSGPFGCTTCPFFDMCTLHEEGGDWEDLRDWKYDRRDPYSDHRKAA